MATFDRKDDYLFVRWAQAVKKRDHFTCQICSAQGTMLNSHHLNAWASYPDERYDVNNGTTLCHSCHDRYHQIYGKGDNTKEQFEEFEKMCELLSDSSKKKIMIQKRRDAVMNHIRADGYFTGE